MKPGFRAWLEQRFRSRPDVASTRLSNCHRVERHYGDLDLLYGTHRMLSLLRDLAYTMEDERRGRSNPSKIPIDGDLRTGLATLRSAVGLYIEFREERKPATPPPLPQREPPIGVIDGDEVVLKATSDLEIDLLRLVARCAIWVDPSVVDAHRKKHPHAAVFPDCRRGKKDEPRRGMMNGVRFDDNSKANFAIKCAVFGSRDRCQRLHVCHVWPETCYDVRYHTSLANLVLLPAALAGLSDHHKGVTECLQYRSYELFGWHPEEVRPPIRPADYPSAVDWATPSFISQDMRSEFVSGENDDLETDDHPIQKNNILNLVQKYLKNLLTILH